MDSLETIHSSDLTDPPLVFIGTLDSVPEIKSKSENAHVIKLTEHTFINKPTTTDRGQILMNWSSIGNTDSTSLFRVSVKSLKLGKVRADVGSSGNFRSKDKLAMIFIPCKSSSSDFKLHIIKNSIDREFMRIHSVCLDLPPPRIFQCENCRSCPCIRLLLTGASPQQKVETMLMNQSLCLIHFKGKPFFQGNYNFYEERLKQLRSNRNESLKHMKILERKLCKIAQMPQFSNVIELFNKKFLKLFSTGLCLALTDPLLKPYESTVTRHYIRWSFAGRLESSATTPIRPITDHSFIGNPLDQELVPASDIDKSCKATETLSNKNTKGKNLSFNNCLLNNVKTLSDLYRSCTVFRVLQLIWCFDVKSFYWCCALPLETSLKQSFWWKEKGLGSDSPWTEYCSRSCLFGASASPPLCEKILHRSCLGLIPHVKGCTYSISKHAIQFWSYVDNLLVGKDRGELFEENVSLFDMMKDITDCIAQGSLAVQDHITCYHLPFKDDTPESELQLASEKVEKFMTLCQSQTTNDTRLVTGHREFVILGAIARNRISVLEFSGRYHEVKDFLLQQNNKSSAATFWEEAFLRGDINGSHPFQDQFDSYIGNLYKNKNPKVSVNIVSDHLPVNQLNVSDDIVTDSPDTVPSLLQREIGNAIPSLSDLSSTAEHLSTQQLLTNMPQFVSLYPKFYSQRHAAHIAKRLETIQANLKPAMSQDMTEDDSKYLSLRFHPLTDTFSYKLGISLSRNIRGITDGRILSFEDLEHTLLTKPVTKREFLSYIQKMSYDPSHLLNGFVIICRLAYRQLLLENSNQLWSSHVDKKYIKDFLIGVREIYHSTNLEIPRSISPLFFDKDIDSVQGILISDAGEDALGYCLYLKHYFTNKKTGKPETYTVLVRTGVRVTPLAFLTSPRKELIAFEFGVAEAKHYLHYLSPYYQHMKPVVYCTDSLSLLQKLLVTSCIFEVFTACRLERIREMIEPENIFTSLAFIHGGKLCSQANLADLLTKSSMRFHHLASFEFFYGSWINLPTSEWPVLWLKDIQAPNVRQFSDLLRKYQSYAERLGTIKTTQSPTEDEVKVHLIHYLERLTVAKSILKTTSSKTEPPSKEPLDHSSCFLFDSVPDEDIESDPELDSVCEHQIPVNWTVEIDPPCSKTPTQKRVSFLNLADVQDFRRNQPPIAVKRFMPLTPEIYQTELINFDKQSHSDLAILMLQLFRSNKELFVKPPVNKLSQPGIFLVSIKKSKKPRNLHKRATKIKTPKKTHSILSKTKIRSENLPAIQKYSKLDFTPLKQPFDDLLNRSNNIFDVFGTLSQIMKWRPKYKNTPKFFLFKQVEKALLAHCKVNMLNYIKSSAIRADRFVVVQDIVIERLRSVSPGYNDLAGRVFLAPNLAFSRCLQRTIHSLYCGASARFQQGILFKLGFSIPGNKKYFEQLTYKSCMRCVRRRAQRQVNQLGPVPRNICVYNKPYSITSVDLSHHYYFRDKKFKTPVIIAHFVCLQTTHSTSFLQKSTSAQDFLNSILKFIGFIGSCPQMLICDQGPEIKSISRQIHEKEAENLGETRQSSKGKRDSDFDKFMMKFTNKEKANLINKMGKLSCLLVFHASSASFQSTAESYINNFRIFWQRAGYDRLNCDIFQMSSCVSLTDMALNRRPLFIVRKSDSQIYEITAQDLFTGQTKDFPNEQHITSLNPLNVENVLAQISVLAASASRAFQTLHSERFAKLLTFYKDNKITSYTKLLERELQVGDVCLLHRRDDPHLKLCIITELSQPGTADYSDASEAIVSFVPHKVTEVKDDLQSVWKKQSMRVNTANLAPIMGHDQHSADLTILPDHDIQPEQLDQVNAEISKIPQNIKNAFWSKLSNAELFTFPISRVLLNECSSRWSTDPFYLSSRDVIAGVPLNPPIQDGNESPTTIVKRLLPPPEYSSETMDDPLPNPEVVSEPFHNRENPDDQLEQAAAGEVEHSVPETNSEPNSVAEPLPSQSTNPEISEVSNDSSSATPTESLESTEPESSLDSPATEPIEATKEVVTKSPPPSSAERKSSRIKRRPNRLIEN